MVTKEDVMLIHDVAIKVRKKLDSIEKDEEFYQELNSLTKKERLTILTITDKGNKTMGEIADKLGVTISTPTYTVTRLIEKGYVCRQRGEEDRRLVLVSLTEKGKKFFENVIDLKTRKLELIFENLSDIEFDMFRKLMQKLDRTL